MDEITKQFEKLDINTCSLEDLKRINGIGGTISSNIVNYRSHHGQIKSVDELSKIDGIGPKKMQVLKVETQVYENKSKKDQQKDPSNSVNNLSLTSTGEELPDPPRLKPGRYIFISYASKDLDVVLPIMRKLLEQGIPIWIDIQQISPGELWDAELGGALRRCKGMVCCLSEEWFASQNCRTELRAMRRRLEAKEIPSNAICPIVIKKWKGEIPDDCYYNLSGDSTQRVDFTVAAYLSERWLACAESLISQLQVILKS